MIDQETQALYDILHNDAGIDEEQLKEDLPLELGMRQNLTRQLTDALRAIGRPVELHLY